MTTREGGEPGNNYGRSSGQNVGNFLTERKTSRVLREPGGGSSFVFGGNRRRERARRAGNDEGTRSRGESPGSRAQRAAIAAIAGSDIFACPKPRVSKISDAKLAEFRPRRLRSESSRAKTVGGTSTGGGKTHSGREYLRQRRAGETTRAARVGTGAWGVQFDQFRSLLLTGVGRRGRRGRRRRRTSRR